MTRLVAFDPGLTTGVAVFEDGEIVFLDSIPKDDLWSRYDNLVLLGEGAEIVIERMPQNLRPKLRGVVVFFDELFPGARKIWPGTWKPLQRAKFMKIARVWDRPFPQSQHERDAYHLGRYALWTSRERSIE